MLASTGDTPNLGDCLESLALTSSGLFYTERRQTRHVLSPSEKVLGNRRALVAPIRVASAPALDTAWARDPVFLGLSSGPGLDLTKEEAAR